MTFNIISNNCVAGRYYELCKQQFPNQFMWNLIKLSDFIKIIKNYDNIDFNNIQLVFTNNEMHKDHSNDKCSTIILNDINAKIYFIHHHYCEEHKSKKVHRINCNVEYEIAGYDILTYIKNKWITRLRRNIKNNIKPVFVYCDTDTTTDCDIIELTKIKNKNIILFSYNDYAQYNSENFHYIKQQSTNTISLANQLKMYLEENKIE